jgi:AcrR family transcriptional regulator
MPKTVDHDERRRELAAAAWRVIAAHGIDEVTTRQIARESGYSNGVLQHYFENKDEILLGALQLSHVEINERYRLLTDDVSAVDGLRSVLYDNLPEDDQRALETRVEMSFWVRALSNANLRAVQVTESSTLQNLLRGLAERAQQDEALGADVDRDTLTAVLAALIDGLSLHALLYPERFPGGRATALMDFVLNLVGVDTSDALEDRRRVVQK